MCPPRIFCRRDRKLTFVSQDALRTMLNHKQVILFASAACNFWESRSNRGSRQCSLLACQSSWRRALRDFSDLRRQTGSRSLTLALASRFQGLLGMCRMWLAREMRCVVKRSLLTPATRRSRKIWKKMICKFHNFPLRHDVTLNNTTGNVFMECAARSLTWTCRERTNCRHT